MSSRDSGVEGSSGSARPAVGHVTTQSVVARDRFEYWRSFFAGGVDMQPSNAASTLPFQGELTWLSGRGDTFFNHIRVDAISSRFRASPADGSFLMTCLVRGRVEMSDPSGRAEVASEGLFLLDNSRPVTTRATRRAFGFLKLPRALVLEAVGVEPMPPRGGILRLTNEPLAPFLSSQLRLLSARGASLDPHERGVAMDAAVDMALGLLKNHARAGQARSEPSVQGVFAAAKIHIERFCHQVDLTPERVASALGCSRARLYRAFAEREVAVFELIRETRMRRSQALLVAHPRREIGAIALDCGYDDPSTFYRAFKRRFGISPSQWRARQLEAEDSPLETESRVDPRRAVYRASDEHRYE